ncbi:MAG: hypothetical protein ACM3SY_06555 [Candidatus Omnitrophota bacterium]
MNITSYLIVLQQVFIKNRFRFTLSIILMASLLLGVYRVPLAGQNVGNPIPPSQGGEIRFQPEGGTYKKSLYIRLSYSPLKSLKGEVILSDICYTLDGSEPTRTHGRKCSRGQSILFSKEGIFTLKARLISKVGLYQGEVYSRTYTIRLEEEKAPTPLQPVASLPDKAQPQPAANTPATNPPNQESPTSQPSNVVTNLNRLDPDSQEVINDKTKKIIIENPGILNIKKSDDVVKMRLTITDMGNANLSDISGISVEPADKLSDIKSSLCQKIQGITFPPPTIDLNPVEVRIWLEFNKIAKYDKYIIFEQI